MKNDDCRNCILISRPGQTGNPVRNQYFFAATVASCNKIESSYRDLCFIVRTKLASEFEYPTLML